MKITANGIRDGEKLEVTYDGKEFLFDGMDNPFLALEIRAEMSELHPIGGTFVVDDKNDIRNIIEVLTNYFFDRPTLDVTCSEEIEPIPTYDDEAEDIVY